MEPKCPKCGGRGSQVFMEIYCVTDCGKCVKQTGEKFGQYTLISSVPVFPKYVGHRFAWISRSCRDLPTAVQNEIDYAEKYIDLISESSSHAVYEANHYKIYYLLVKDFPG